MRYTESKHKRLWKRKPCFRPHSPQCREELLHLNLSTGLFQLGFEGIGFVLRHNAQGAVTRTADDDGTVRVAFQRDGTFLVKPALVTELAAIPAGSRVVVDGTGEYLDHDVKEALAAFVADAPSRQLDVRLEGIELAGVTAGAH